MGQSHKFNNALYIFVHFLLSRPNISNSPATASELTIQHKLKTLILVLQKKSETRP
jgi:hypothetical protein